MAMFTAEQLNVITAAVWSHCRSLAQMTPAEQTTSIAATRETPVNLREAVRTTLLAVSGNAERERGFSDASEVLRRLQQSPSQRTVP